VDGRLDKRWVDVTVVKPHNYDFKNSEIVSRKGYFFMEPSVGIELKLNKLKPRQEIYNEIRETLSNLELLRQHRDESTFYLVFFDRVVGFDKKEIETWRIDYPNIRIIYSFQPWSEALRN
jgi:hypothetical protein